METFIKHTSGSAAGWERAGLEWLTAAEESGGARVCRVLGVTEDGLELERIAEAAPSKAAARAFGQGLAMTHDAGAPAWGAAPEGWRNDGFQGPAGQQIPLQLGAWDSWGRMYAAARVAPLAGRLSGLDPADRALLDRLCERLRAGEFDDDDAPSRIHGDLWAGNVLWSPEEAVLIDPMAYGGHREDDLAALALFGAPHLREIVAGYEQARPLEPGWQERVELHQLHLVLLHAVLFGGGYVNQALSIARRYA
ncbi:fructosamine kinase family protein [Rothia sp. AR01]|uniref:Fructosamine kinase family protein n=1 Tax=Rothia santali TaxID=2949643 RepID=A0A9X2HF77_9MICC|nr:fructosamine kinase family protein [Rothia santali]MCP3426597.1 fructosamine kinase family protein [Rothia santali]